MASSINSKAVCSSLASSHSLLLDADFLVFGQGHCGVFGGHLPGIFRPPNRVVLGFGGVFGGHLPGEGGRTIGRSVTNRLAVTILSTARSASRRQQRRKQSDTFSWVVSLHKTGE